MRRWLWLGLFLGLTGLVWAQSGAPSSSSTPPSPSSNTDTPKAAQRSSLAPPRSDRVNADDLGSELGQSSSKDTQLDLSAPDDDDKKHPQSSAVVSEADAGSSGGGSGITEFRTWDPHKAAKSIEVGDFYYKRGNYKAAEGRYREALGYKANDAVATIRLATCLEKLGVMDDARAEYESYLKILPHGPEAEQAEKALNRLKAREENTKAQ